MSESVVEAQGAPGTKGLKTGALGLAENVVIGVASTAPAYSLAVSLGLVAAAVGLASPSIMWVAFIPMFCIAIAYYYMNRADPDCGTSFTWVTRSMGPHLGWMTGWVMIVAQIVVIASLAEVAAQYTFSLFGIDVFENPVIPIAVGDVTFDAGVIGLGVLFVVAMTWICWRGIELSADDLLRRAVIGALMCHFHLAKESFATSYLIDFDKYFATELEELRGLARPVMTAKEFAALSDRAGRHMDTPEETRGAESVAARAGFDYPAAVRQGSRIRVATKYMQIARQHFADKGVHVDLIKLYGSMELAPLTGLAEAIVDGSRRDLEGKKVLVTAGPTHEAIDPVRGITNRSSGRMGYAIAQAAVVGPFPQSAGAASALAGVPPLLVKAAAAARVTARPVWEVVALLTMPPE